jgi:hypothetical protein
MSMTHSLSKFVLISAVFGASVFGQSNSPSIPSSAPNSSANSAVSLPPLSSQFAPSVVMQWLAARSVFITSQTVKDRPFQAEVNGRQTMTRPDGMQMVSETHEIVARDAEGRMVEKIFAPPRGGRSYYYVNVYDPAGGTQMRWTVYLEADGSMMRMLDPQAVNRTSMMQTAGRRPIAMPQLNPCNSDPPRNLDVPQMHQTGEMENLGTKMFANVSAEGCRVTITRASRPNSDGPLITTVEEDWVSSELQIMMRSTHQDDGVKQDDIEEVDDVILGAPDPSLFAPPADYKVQDLDAFGQPVLKALASLPKGVARAESFAGAWETENPFLGRGHDIGFFVDLSMMRASQAPREAGAVETTPGIGRFDVVGYQRPGMAGVSWNTAYPESVDGRAAWDGKKLYVDMGGGAKFDLTFDAATASWNGSYTMGETVKPVRFARPGASLKIVTNPMAGTWLAGANAFPAACMRILQADDGSLVGWANSPGPPTSGRGPRGTIFVPGALVAASAYVVEEIDGVPMEIGEKDGKVTIGIHRSAGGIAGAIAALSFASVSADGTQLLIGPTLGPSTVYTKSGSESCFAVQP